ncbi:protein SSXA1-like [Ochotona curzoniae]|uniref:protein SSXA1-like n=1 Tax=Ochotona curzoniae TaxID=130825 RepID=UPI001B34C1D7|nr:protein SSXA1-like [Ochotona curzoniae]
MLQELLEKLEIRDDQPVSLQAQTVSRAMNKEGSSSKSLGADPQKSDKSCKAFQDISQYFSKKEWEKMGYSEKITYVYMKRNYTTMTRLGFKRAMPDFMRSGIHAKRCCESDSDEEQNTNTERRAVKKEESGVWSHRLRERKYVVAYEEISDPEEED